jgi:transcriptional regulator with XRE-family HTH domain
MALGMGASAYRSHPLDKWRVTALRDHREVDAVRLGLAIRALRRRQHWTQRQLGDRCDMSSSEISRLERGGARTRPLGSSERVLEALGARLLVRVLWQGEELDRLLDRGHASLVDVMLRELDGGGWVAIPEATFHVYGERGSIDILAWHRVTRVLLVIEIKSVVPDVQATLAGLDRKARLAPRIVEDRGWRAMHVARLLVLPADRTSRRRVAAFAATFDRALPTRTTAVKRWLRAPSGPLAGILFLPNVPRTQPRQRIRRSATLPEHGHPDD